MGQQEQFQLFDVRAAYRTVHAARYPYKARLPAWREVILLSSFVTA